MATDQRLKLLARNVNLDNPEEVKDFIDFIKTAQVSLDNLYQHLRIFLPH